MNEGLSVRVDYYKDGKIVPISFVDTSSTTKYICKIREIWQETDSKGMIIIRYLCLLSDSTLVTLLFRDNEWFIEH